jgi:hypothetical protein
MKSIKEINTETKEGKYLLMAQHAKALHINKNGSPKHPLYCKTDIQPVQFNQSKNTQS